MTTSQTEPRPLNRQIATALIIIAGVVGVFTAWMAIRLYQASETDRKYYFPVVVWGVLVACLTGVIGIFRHFEANRQEEGGKSIYSDAMLIGSLGGFVGVAMVSLLGGWYGYLWWDQLVGGRSEWKSWRPWVVVGSMLAGLVVMFASAVVMRSEESGNPAIRRYIYGYNAVLTGLLLLGILIVVNVFGFFYLSEIYDWTATSMYTVSPMTKHILENLEKPVKVYVVFQPVDVLYEDLQTLLTVCKGYSNKLDVEYVRSPGAYRDLDNKYNIPDDTALVVVYDPDGDAKHQTILNNDLEEFNQRMRTDNQQRSFKGEQSLLSAINALQEGKVARAIYFTQGSGEMKLSDFNRGEDIRRLDRGLGTLKGRLEKNNYTAKELNLGELDPKTRNPIKVPDDAYAVIMAAPTGFVDPQTGPAKINELEEYMKRPNAHLLILLEPTFDRQGALEATGLEGFLAEFGVQVGKDMILHPTFRSSPQPTVAHLKIADSSDRAFRDGRLADTRILLLNVRSVQPIAQSPAPFMVNTLLDTVPFFRDMNGHWAETNLPRDPEAFVHDLQDKKEEELDRKMKGPPISAAVTVRDRSGPSGAPNDPMHSQIQSGSPRMVVIGCGSFVSNSLVNQGARDSYYSLIASALAWLGNRQEGIVLNEIPPKERRSYKFNTTPQQAWDLVKVSGPVMLIVVIAFGTGIWFLRRR